MTFLSYLWSMKQYSATWIRFSNNGEASPCTKRQGAFCDRHSPHACIGYSREYGRHPNPQRECTQPEGRLELPEQKRYSLSTLKAHKIHFSNFMEHHKGHVLDLLTVGDINSYMLHYLPARIKCYKAKIPNPPDCLDDD